MSEYGLVERPILDWLCGDDHETYDASSPPPGFVGGLGWTYRSETMMGAYGRPMEDPLVELILVDKLKTINPGVSTDAQALMAVAALRKAMLHPDKLTANHQTLELLRDGAKLQLTPGADATTVNFIEFDPEKPSANDFTATNQYRIQGVKQCRTGRFCFTTPGRRISSATWTYGGGG